MRILFAFANGHLPEFSGGVQSNTDFLANHLRRRGHECAVLCSLFGKGVFGLGARIRLKVGGRPIARDTKLGYPVFRAWSPVDAVAAAVEAFKPDVAVVQCHKTVPLAEELRKAGIPIVIYLHNVEFHELGGSLSSVCDASFVANSEFTQKRYQQAFGIESAVVPPGIEPGLYRTESSRQCVTFINPVEKKGLETAAAVARACPDIPFQFVESWTLSAAQQQQLDEVLNLAPNITYVRRTRDMRQVFSKTKLLLVPSRWEEAWGRVVSEAQVSGIPVLATRIGGLSEAVGPGGILFEVDQPATDWVAAVRDLWADSDRYRMLAERAEQHAHRADMAVENQLAKLETAFRQAIAGNDEDAPTSLLERTADPRRQPPARLSASS